MEECLQTGPPGGGPTFGNTTARRGARAASHRRPPARTPGQTRPRRPTVRPL